MSSQKSKASVARSGSIGARRPPTRRPQAGAARLPKIESVDDSETDAPHVTSNDDESASTNLSRLKSCSNDEIRSDGVNETDEPLLDRSSRFRRSLQFAQSKRAADADRKAVGGELEVVLKKVLGKKLRAVNGRGDIGDVDAMAVDERSLIRPASASKKPSFVTVENLKKTKNNLRHLNGSLEADNKNDDDDDDGIETDAKPPGDSRSLDYRGSALAKTDEWYNRRKSYGFEKVHTSDRHGGENDAYAAATATAASSVVDSSTDSGICRSTENGLSNSSRQSSVDRESIADLVKKYSGKEINNNNNGLQVHAYNTTVVAKGKILEAINSLRLKSSAYFDVVKSADTVSNENDDEDNGGQVSDLQFSPTSEITNKIRTGNVDGRVESLEGFRKNELENELESFKKRLRNNTYRTRTLSSAYSCVTRVSKRTGQSTKHKLYKVGNKSTYVEAHRLVF